MREKKKDLRRNKEDLNDKQRYMLISSMAENITDDTDQWH
jgi:hypothetical protein